jgi:hypothetical protein
VARFDLVGYVPQVTHVGVLFRPSGGVRRGASGRTATTGAAASTAVLFRAVRGSHRDAARKGAHRKAGNRPRGRAVSRRDRRWWRSACNRPPGGWSAGSTAWPRDWHPPRRAVKSRPGLFAGPSRGRNKPRRGAREPGADDRVLAPSPRTRVLRCRRRPVAVVTATG